MIEENFLEILNLFYKLLKLWVEEMFKKWYCEKLVVAIFESFQN